MRSVWRDLNENDVDYIPRCSKCGTYKTDYYVGTEKHNNLKVHWFFTGIYCVSCIIDNLYDDTRNLKERP